LAPSKTNRLIDFYDVILMMGVTMLLEGRATDSCLACLASLHSLLHHRRPPARICGSPDGACHGAQHGGSSGR
jgi:hypothetical protein